MEKHIDKRSWYHFGACLLPSLLGGLYGACIAEGAAVTKEYCDKVYSGHWCWWDLLFDNLGIITGVSLNHLLLFILL